MGLTAGGTFGDYQVVRRLGKGGMGEVWLLRGKSGRLIAAKILDPATADDLDARRRFLREAELAMGVRHPHLVETYDVGEDPESGLCYILMEYVPGGTLAHLLKTGGALSIEDAVSVVAAMADVLELGRRKGIVHRDIKPANIMFDAEGTPKLADLGIARRGGAGVETTTVTRAGVMIGTPAYMAPEQMFDSHNVDTRADIYSLGVVFFEMLAGVRPNKDDTLVELMAKAVSGEPLPDVRTLRPEVSASLARLLGRMVEPDRDRRISTPGQVTNALSVIERGGSPARPNTSGGAIVPHAKAAVLLRVRRILWRTLLFVSLSAAIVMTVQRGPRLRKELRNSWRMVYLRLAARPSGPAVPPSDGPTDPVPDPVTVSPPSVPPNPVPDPVVVPPPSVQPNPVPDPVAVPPPSVPTNPVPDPITVHPPSVPTNPAPAPARSPHPLPTLTVRAMVGGQPVAGARIVRGSAAGATLPWTSAALGEGETVSPLVIEYRRDGRKWRGSLEAVSVDWEGARVRTCELQEFYECEFVPYVEGWMGGVRYPVQIDSVDVRGCAEDGILLKTNGLGGASAFVSLRGKRLATCFVTVSAEGMSGTACVQLTPHMPDRVRVKMSK